MNINRFATLIVAFLLISIACKKNTETVISPKVQQPDIYVAGFRLTNYTSTFNNPNIALATYWKNGVAHTVNDTLHYSIAKAIVVVNNDIYMTGYAIGNDNAQHTTLWKNGVATQISSEFSDATSLTVNGTDVYISGYTISNDDKVSMVYWKNGIKIPIVGNAGLDKSTIALNGSDVYIAGTSSINNKGEQASYWKNGIVNVIDTLGYSEGNAMVLNGSDIYIAGTVNANNTITPVYWKNGVASQAFSGSPQTIADAIVLDKNNNVYVGGSAVSSNFKPVATYWENGNAITLTDLSFRSYVYAMASDGNDIYAAGSVGMSSVDDTPLAIYWKNGASFQLAKSFSVAYAIFITHATQ